MELEKQRAELEEQHTALEEQRASLEEKRTQAEAQKAKVEEKLLQLTQVNLEPISCLSLCWCNFTRRE